MNTKQLAQKWFEEVWNKKNGAFIAEMMDPSVVGVTEGGEVRGPADFKQKVFEPLVQAFPDVKVTVEGIISEGDEAAVRWTVSATHKGVLMHLAATGKRVKFSGITWLKFKNGRIVGGSDSYNLHGLIGFLTDGTESASVRRG